MSLRPWVEEKDNDGLFLSLFYSVLSKLALSLWRRQDLRWHLRKRRDNFFRLCSKCFFGPMIDPIVLFASTVTGR